MLCNHDRRRMFKPRCHRRLLGFLRLAALPGSIAAILISTGLCVRAESANTESQRYDGNWSVEVVTERGPCDRAYRHKIVIENGKARYAGSDFVVSGGVRPNGAVGAVISRGSSSARVVGRLAGGYGNGTWILGVSSVCSGQWNAERRG